MYVAEVAPAQLRGVMFGFISWWQSFGTLIGTIVANSTSSIPTRRCYEIPLGLCLVIPGLLIIILPFFPESPRCTFLPVKHRANIKGLISKGREQQAGNALRRIRGGHVPETAIQKELEDINEAHALEMALKKSRVSLLDLFRGVERVTSIEVHFSDSLATHPSLYRLWFDANGHRFYFLDQLLVLLLSRRWRIASVRRQYHHDGCRSHRLHDFVLLGPYPRTSDHSHDGFFLAKYLDHPKQY
jgi:MFS family permease